MTNSQQLEKIRIDKWLWAVRMFKTRSLATDACNAGRVKINGDSVKPARNIAIGETITMQFGQDKKILKVVQLIENRVSFAIASTCYEDFSPPPIPRKITQQDSVFHPLPTAMRERGTGRPTKKERRSLDDFIHDSFEDENE